MNKTTIIREMRITRQELHQLAALEALHDRTGGLIARPYSKRRARLVKTWWALRRQLSALDPIGPYRRGKAAARAAAIDWQTTTTNRPTTWAELTEKQAHFEKLARRYGLITEFRANGII